MLGVPSSYFNLTKSLIYLKVSHNITICRLSHVNLCCKNRRVSKAQRAVKHRVKKWMTSSSDPIDPDLTRQGVGPVGKGDGAGGGWGGGCVGVEIEELEHLDFGEEARDIT